MAKLKIQSRSLFFPALCFFLSFFILGFFSLYLIYHGYTMFQFLQSFSFYFFLSLIISYFSYSIESSLIFQISGFCGWLLSYFVYSKLFSISFVLKNYFHFLLFILFFVGLSLIYYFLRKDEITLSMFILLIFSYYVIQSFSFQNMHFVLKNLYALIMGIIIVFLTLKDLKRSISLIVMSFLFIFLIQNEQFFSFLS